MRKILYSLLIIAGVVMGLSTILIPQGYAQSETPTADSTCTNLLLNGGMENSVGWNLTSGVLPAQYVSTAHTGSQSLSLGPAKGQTLDRIIWSAAWQAVDLPDESVVTLSFWYRPETELDPGNDRHYAVLLDEDGLVIEPFFNTLQEDKEWRFFSSDISAQAGRTVRVYFGVENDGIGGVTRLLVDEVQVCAYSSDTTAVPQNTTQPKPITATLSKIPTALPTPTRTPVSTPTPTLTRAPTLPPQSTPTPTLTPAPTPTVMVALLTSPTAAASPLLYGEEVIDFSRLGFHEANLRAPFDSTQFRFRLPADWEPAEGAELQLDLTTFNFGAVAATAKESHAVLNGSLEIILNDMLLGSILLDQSGDRSVTIPITTTALIPVRSDGRHELILSLNAAISCDVDEQMNVVVRPSSRFVIPYRLSTPVTDLRFLPQPIYQGSFRADVATIVIPDQPTEDEMQAALAVAAGFGEMTDRKLVLSLIPLSQLTPKIRDTTHLIFVGSPAAFPILNDVPLPAPIENSNFEAPDAIPEDGIIQMIVSPWNKSKVLLVVGGNSDEAIVKAGQAVSSGIVRVSGQPNLALVAGIQSGDLLVNPETVDRTFADLGYSTQQLKRKGQNYADYNFYIPSGYTTDAEAYLELVFNHSALLNYEESGIVVTLNGQPIGSVRLSDESISPTRVRFRIPRSAIQSGKNELQPRASLAPGSECLDPGLDGVWLTIWPESVMHLPLILLPKEPRAIFELRDYPAPFAQDPTLSNTAFIVPSNNPTAWNVAAQIAFDLGDRGDILLAELVAVYGDAVPENIRQNRNLIVIGRPSALLIIDEMSDVLPAPFEAGSDLASERNMRVHYRLSPDASVGYLQLFPASWNPSRIVLAVLGSTDQGVQWAGKTLTTANSRGKLKNNLAVINDEQISFADTQPRSPAQEPGAEGVAQPVANAETPEPGVSAFDQVGATPASTGNKPATETLLSTTASPRWILPLLGASSILMIIIVAAVVISSRRRR